MNLQQATTHIIQNALFDNNSLTNWGLNLNGAGGYIASWNNV